LGGAKKKPLAKAESDREEQRRRSLRHLRRKRVKESRPS